MDHLQGCVRGRMLRLGQMTLMFFAGTRGALDSEGNESADRTEERSATSAHLMAPAQEDQGYLAAAPTSQQWALPHIGIDNKPTRLPPVVRA